MYSMDNLGLDMMNRHYMYEAHSFLGNPAIPSVVPAPPPPHCGLAATAASLSPIVSQLPSRPSGSTGSCSGSEFYPYDDNSRDNLSTCSSSEQENQTRKRNCAALKRPRQAAQQRKNANLRERRRMQNINDAFEDLRAHLPTMPYEKRLSKVDTLKLAIGYIKILNDLLRADKGAGDSITASGALSRCSGRVDSMKVIVYGSAGNQFISHSLSWSRKNDILPNGTIFAKVWTPEDPRTSKNPTSYE